MENLTVCMKPRARVSSSISSSSSICPVGMEMVLKIVMPWLSAQDVGQLARTCKAMAEAARSITSQRLRDATQGWENIVVPIENHVDDCLYPNFQYTPFSRLSAIAAPTGLPFGGPWGGGEEVAKTRKKGVSESEFGGAMVLGSVLLGPGVGCRCPGDCSTVSQSISDGRRPEFLGDQGGRISGSLARRQPDLDNREPFGDSWKKNKRRREDHQGGTADSLPDRNDEQETTQDVLDCCNTSPIKASFCPCGRFMGGEPAYDINLRLRVQNVNPLKISRAVTQGLDGSRSPKIVEDNLNSMQVLHQDAVDGGEVTGNMDDPPLVMECGQVCSCSYLCKYRVSQNGLAVRAKVVRTSFKGWGLCANQAITQGSFVCEYAGELITTGNARERQQVYDSEKHGKHWQGSALLTVREHLPSGHVSVRVNVDATRIGNVARFINHSCDGGNLVPCLIRTAGCVIPKLALFARRTISDGEEFSYSYGSADTNAEPSKPCFCGTPACMGRLPSECTE